MVRGGEVRAFLSHGSRLRRHRRSVPAGECPRGPGRPAAAGGADRHGGVGLRLVGLAVLHRAGAPAQVASAGGGTTRLHGLCR